MAHKKRKTTHPMIAALNRMLAKTRHTNEDVARVIGMTEGAVRRMRRLGRSPKNALARKALEDFVAQGSGA